MKAVLLMIFLGSCCLASPSPKDLVEIGGKFYYFSPNAFKANVVDATSICNDDNMTLLNLETLEEAALIREYILANGYDSEQFWTSGRILEETWMWTGSGKLFNKVDWYPGQPDMSIYENKACTFLRVNGTLWDYQCTEKFRFICEQVVC